WNTGKRVGPDYKLYEDFRGEDYKGIVFSPDGRSAATCGQIWDRAPLQCDVSLIVLWTKVLTQLELDDNESVRRLDEGSWDERRLELARRTKDLAESRLAGADTDRIAWLHRIAVEAEKTEKWPAAVDHLTQLLAKGSNKEKLLRRRGLGFVKLRQWQK